MKKLTKGLLAVSLTALIVGAVGCNCNGGETWHGTDFTDYGRVVAESNGGFVAETDKFVYFINGVETSSSDNTFGTPIKGSLVALDKSDPAKMQVVIPELIVSSDYDAGVYVFQEGDKAYAYYGTPNREKNSSGEVASSEMTFTKTCLDGTGNTKLFTVSSHSTSFRMVQDKDGAVNVVYYDEGNSCIVCYNAKTGKSSVIAKTDDKVNDATDGEYLSLDEYKFFDNGNSAQVVYTMKVYTQEYNEAQEKQQESYSRQTASYNYMYIYSVDGGSKCVKNGKTTETTYTLKACVDDYLFYTAKTLVGGSEKTYGVKLAALDADKEISYPDNIKDDMIIKSFEEVYFFDSTDGKIIKTTLVNEPLPEREARKVLVKDSAISSLISIDEDYAYCYNSDGNIIAVNYKDGDDFGKTIKISERKASTGWYAPETVVIGGETYILYCDASDEGRSYVFSANLSGLNDPLEKDTDDDGEIDEYYLESSFVGVMPAADRAAVVATKLNAISGTLDLQEGETGYYDETVNAARAAYDALDPEAKNVLSSDALAKLTNAEKAIKLADAYITLESVKTYNGLSQAGKDALKTALEPAYNEATSIKESYGSNYSTIAAYLSNNLNYYYQVTYDIFNPSESK